MLTEELVLLIIILYIIYKDLKSLKEYDVFSYSKFRKNKIFFISKILHALAFVLFLMCIILNKEFYLSVAFLWFFSEFLYTFNPVSANKGFEKIIKLMRYVSFVILLFIIFVLIYNCIRD